MSTLYLGRIISEACFLLQWPHAALLVCGVSFPHGSSREKACRLSRAKCKGSVTSCSVGGQITDKSPHRECYGVFTTSWSQESIFIHFYRVVFAFKIFLQTLIVYIDPIMPLRDTYPLLRKSFPLRKRKGSMFNLYFFR